MGLEGTEESMATIGVEGEGRGDMVRRDCRARETGREGIWKWARTT